MLGSFAGSSRAFSLVGMERREWAEASQEERESFVDVEDKDSSRGRAARPAQHLRATWSAVLITALLVGAVLALVFVPRGAAAAAAAGRGAVSSLAEVHAGKSVGGGGEEEEEGGDEGGAAGGSARKGAGEEEEEDDDGLGDLEAEIAALDGELDLAGADEEDEDEEEDEEEEEEEETGADASAEEAGEDGESDSATAGDGEDGDEGAEDAGDDGEGGGAGGEEKPQKEQEPAHAAHKGKKAKGKKAAGRNSSAAFCCYSAASGLPRTPQFCSTCYTSAAATGGDFCSESYENCATCGPQATWCQKGKLAKDTRILKASRRTKQCDAVNAKLAAAEAAKPKESIRYYNIPPIPEETCSTSADNCKDTKCCSESGFQCWTKNEFWAGCRESCDAGVAPGWSCTVLSKPETSASVLAKSPKEPSFFCWSIIRDSGFEPVVAKEQYRSCASIFGCEAWAVFSKAPVTLSQGNPPVRTTLLPSTLRFSPPKRGGLGKFATPSWVNVDPFLAAWDMIGTSGEYEKHDWTIKVDPDAVFLPARLRRHMHDYGGADGIYLTNCKGVRHALYGSLEIVSKGGVRKFVGGLRHCTKTLEYGGWGEDLFLQKCLDLNGVHHADDFFLVSDGCCLNDVGQDGVCQHKKPCKSGEMAFHPFKDAKAYMKCWDEATS